MQRKQAAWRGVLVCVCANRGETDQALSRQRQQPDPSSVGAGRTGTVARHARNSAACDQTPRPATASTPGASSTLIPTPVGFGKSTLLSDWLASRAIPVAWLSLEPQDNEPVRFLSYLLAALQTYDPHLSTTRRVLHHPLQPPLMEAILTLLINDLLIGRGTTQEHFVLVLDNYQVITDESIHHAL